MKPDADPIIRIAKKSPVLSWVFYVAVILAVMVLASSLKTKPYILGLPAWNAISLIFISLALVIL